jgi:hypothetical protein
VVGATTGVLGAPKGYFKAMKSVCDRYGALYILDEVMCGMGRMGSTHAWQSLGDGVGPDIQAVAKGLGGGLVLPLVLPMTSLKGVYWIDMALWVLFLCRSELQMACVTILAFGNMAIREVFIFLRVVTTANLRTPSYQVCNHPLLDFIL